TLSQPEMPVFRISWLEKCRGLRPYQPKSEFKIHKILGDHPVWVQSLSQFIKSGNEVVFVIGNHDLELHFPKVQEIILSSLNLDSTEAERVRFNEWFYISNSDTLIEHGNQYDPYCVAEDPIRPFVKRFNKIEVRVPFGNLATRYLINGMGFFNPHADTNYLMSAKEYVKFFLRYIVKAQPMLMWTWLWGACVTLFQSAFDRLLSPITNPLTIEDRIEEIARKSNATPRMVRELKELFASPASSDPVLIAQELWLDRAFLVTGAFLLFFQLLIFVKTVCDVSIFWMFVPLFLFLPFFVFYSRSIRSEVIEYKEPSEKILALTSHITKVKRVVYGHTHIARHEIIGFVEHLNCGTWSPAFLDVECKKPIGRKTFVWISPSQQQGRMAQLLEFNSTGVRNFQKSENPRRSA
ncbi:MAG: hypothetical protein KDD22_07910, partial [Bdellovibrionales bacterium]|nr:hypothetical protein [Bdellovibrionales bacterium]